MLRGCSLSGWVSSSVRRRGVGRGLSSRVGPAVSDGSRCVPALGAAAVELGVKAKLWPGPGLEQAPSALAAAAVREDAEAGPCALLRPRRSACVP